MSVDVPDVPIEILPFLKQRPELSIFGTKPSKPPQSSPHPIHHRCDKCPFETTVQQHFHNHMMEHKQQSSKDFPCPICGKIYKVESRLQSHMQTHEQGYCVCMYCEKRFKTQSLLSTHMKTHFPVEVTCPLCNKHFSSKTSLRRHTLSIHGENFQK